MESFKYIPPSERSKQKATSNSNNSEQKSEDATPSVINFYRTGDPYGEFSNFAKFPIELDGKTWKTTEHYFQAQKFVGTKYEEAVRMCPSAKDAAVMGRDRNLPRRDDWESVKDGIMHKCLSAKFTQHQKLKELLLSTGDAKLVEHTTNDSYWADGGDGKGKNMLGVLLMKVREEIREGTKNSNENSNSKTETNSNLNLDEKPTKKTVFEPQKVDLSKLKAQPFDYYIVLDFEATCDEERKIFPQEIIEFPSVLINAKTLQVVDEFHTYVKPESHPTLTPFCIQLTGIQQQWVLDGVHIRDALIQFDKWIKEKGLLEKKFTFVTCGDWDLNKCITNQLKHFQIQKPSYFNTWVNLKKLYANFYNRKMVDMVGMLGGLNLKLEGRHHSGIDDARNIARVLVKMLEDGVVADTTANYGSVHNPRPKRRQ